MGWVEAHQAPRSVFQSSRGFGFSGAGPTSAGSCSWVEAAVSQTEGASEIVAA